MNRSFLRVLPNRGARFVNSRVAAFKGAQSWINLGQGQPEPASLSDYPELTLQPEDLAYGPFEGLPQLRSAVATLYNRLYRSGRSSPLGERNVAIGAGGRVSLSRVIGGLDIENIGLIAPDYMGFEGLISLFPKLQPKVYSGAGSSGFEFPAEQILSDLKRGVLKALLISNPCNPTGQVLPLTTLKLLSETASQVGAPLIIDEFYSQYLWGSDLHSSGAAVIDDFENSTTILIDGITKNFRAPGLRLSWIVAGEEIARKVGEMAGILDGGTSRPIQRFAQQFVEYDRATKLFANTRALFLGKRKQLLSGLRELGFSTLNEPQGSFYVFASLGGTRAGDLSGVQLFDELLRRGVIVIPGEFFDHSTLTNGQPVIDLSKWLRFSFGAPSEQLAEGLERIASCFKQLK